MSKIEGGSAGAYWSSTGYESSGAQSHSVSFEFCGEGGGESRTALHYVRTVRGPS